MASSGTPSRTAAVTGGSAVRRRSAGARPAATGGRRCPRCHRHRCSEHADLDRRQRGCELLSDRRRRHHDGVRRRRLRGGRGHRRRRQSRRGGLHDARRRRSRGHGRSLDLRRPAAVGNVGGDALRAGRCHRRDQGCDRHGHSRSPLRPRTVTVQHRTTRPRANGVVYSPQCDWSIWRARSAVALSALSRASRNWTRATS